MKSGYYTASSHHPELGDIEVSFKYSAGEKPRFECEGEPEHLAVTGIEYDGEQMSSSKWEEYEEEIANILTANKSNWE